MLRAHAYWVLVGACDPVLCPTQDITTFALADEPGWYLPAQSPEHYVANLSTAAGRAVQAEWLRFLQLNKVTAADIGQTVRHLDILNCDPSG